jgi:hypothetical protein
MGDTRAVPLRFRALPAFATVVDRPEQKTAAFGVVVGSGGKTTVLHDQSSKLWRVFSARLYLVLNFASGTRCSSISAVPTGTHGDQGVKTAMPRDGHAGCGNRWPDVCKPLTHVIRPVADATDGGAATEKQSAGSQRGRRNRFATMTFRAIRVQALLLLPDTPSA